MALLNEPQPMDDEPLGHEDPMPDQEDQAQDDATKKPEHILHELMRLMTVQNVAKELTDEQLAKIGSEVCEGFDIDDGSREEWKTRTEAGMDLALQKAQGKTFPWPGAANIRFPLMTTAAIQFNARAYPAIVADNQVVRAQVLGADPQGQRKAIADRVSAHMSWQFLTEMEEWEPELDKLLTNLPIAGCAFKKTYFSPEQGRNRSDFVCAKDLVVNMDAPSLATAPRITHVFRLYPYEIERPVPVRARSFASIIRRPRPTPTMKTRCRTSTSSTGGLTWMMTAIWSPISSRSTRTRRRFAASRRTSTRIASGSMCIPAR
jgi:hypothetical protein